MKVCLLLVVAICGSRLVGQGEIYPNMTADQLQTALDARQRASLARDAALQSRLDELSRRMRLERRDDPIPGETGEQTAMRRSQAVADAEKDLQEKFSNEHHFLPSDWSPHLSESEKEEVIARSDNLARQKDVALQPYDRASENSEILRLEARVKSLERNQNSRTSNLQPTVSKIAEHSTTIEIGLELKNLSLTSGEHFSEAKLMTFNISKGTLTVSAGSQIFVKPLAMFPAEVIAQIRKIARQT